MALACISRPAGEKLGWVMLLAFALPADGQDAPLHTHASLISERQTAVPGETFDLGLWLRMDHPWHTFWKDPGDAGIPTSIRWKLPEGFRVEDIRWPKPGLFTAGGLTSYVYEDEVVLPMRVHVPKAGYTAGQNVKFQGSVSWLECSEVCIPVQAEVEFTLTIGTSPANSSKEIATLFEKYRGQIPADPDYHPARSTAVVSSSGPSPPATQGPSITFWGALLASFLGGMILNIMPCVLPVIAIKILGFVKQGGEDPRRVRSLGLLFGLGVLVSFWVFAGFVVSLRTAGELVGWGFQFQSPWFILIMSLAVTILALNFFGLFEFQLGSATTTTAGQFASREGGFGAFMSGVLATVLATPCTAPFMGTALGFAFSQPPLQSFAIFTALGLGLGLPYVLLAWYPRLLRWLPKPGPWMLRFKQAMGFPMLATALWLAVWNLKSYGGNAIFAVSIWLLLAAFAVWLISLARKGHLAWIGLAVILFLFGARWQVIPAFTAHETLISWQPWSKAALESALKTSQPIFVDFTADWCFNCQVNKKTSLEIESVAQRFKEARIIAFLADNTRTNKEITAALDALKEPGVPTNVFYPVDRGRAPIILPKVLTPQIVLDGLDQAVGPKPGA